MPSLRRPAALLVAAAAVWLWWTSSAGAQADGNGSTTACLCTGPQCFPPCPTTPQFAFCPPRPPASLVPFPWQSAPPKPEFIPQEPGFLAAAAACRGRTAAGWVLPVVVVACSAFLLLLLVDQ